MKYPALIPLASMICLIFPNFADARIGEGRDSFERRLFSNGGIVYRDKEGRNTRKSSGPYAAYMDYLGPAAEVRIYFKTDDGSQPTQSEFTSGADDDKDKKKKKDKNEEEKQKPSTGWEVHVLYMNGRSVLELYKRVGSMSDYESNALLAVLGDGKYWEEKEIEEEVPEETASGKLEPPDTIFNYQYVRSDGKVRASKTGGGVMAFDTQFDKSLARLHEGSLINQAPTSVRGF